MNLKELDLSIFFNKNASFASISQFNLNAFKFNLGEM